MVYLRHNVSSFVRCGPVRGPAGEGRGRRPTPAATEGACCNLCAVHLALCFRVRAQAQKRRSMCALCLQLLQIPLFVCAIRDSARMMLARRASTVSAAAALVTGADGAQPWRGRPASGGLACARPPVCYLLTTWTEANTLCSMFSSLAQAAAAAAALRNSFFPSSSFVS